MPVDRQVQRVIWAGTEGRRRRSHEPRSLAALPAVTTSPSGFSVTIGRVLSVVVVPVHGTLDTSGCAQLEHVLEDLIDNQAHRRRRFWEDAMAVYECRCPECGPFEMARQMGAAPATCTCAQCGAAARRAYSAPFLNRNPRPLAEALTRAEKSRDAPEVVTTIPGRQPNRRPQTDPRLKLLPRW